jgi:hypothetical protein
MVLMDVNVARQTLRSGDMQSVLAPSVLDETWLHHRVPAWVTACEQPTSVACR